MMDSSMESLTNKLIEEKETGVSIYHKLQEDRSMHLSNNNIVNRSSF